MRFKKRAKPAKVLSMLRDLEKADRALCDAVLNNVLTEVGERQLRNLLHWVRECQKDAKRELNMEEANDTRR
jgi:hypothetical protein